LPQSACAILSFSVPTGGATITPRYTFSPVGGRVSVPSSMPLASTVHCLLAAAEFEYRITHVTGADALTSAFSVVLPLGSYANTVRLPSPCSIFFNS
jgi:hypothetical protein